MSSGQDVLTRADGRCECPGTCGGHKPPATGTGERVIRCDQVPVIVTPRAVGEISAVQACRLPAEDLWAICQACSAQLVQHARSTARQRETAAPWDELAGVAQDALFA